MSTLAETPSGASWIRRFDPADREAAAALIDEILLVGRDDFFNNLRELLEDVFLRRKDPQATIALFAERPIKTVYGVIPAYFPGSRRGRAAGHGVPPIVVDPRHQEVGSEGVIAQFITDYCRRNPGVALSHPGPSKMRSSKVREIVLLTDFIGSGQRMEDMLESFRHVATIRSWRSYGFVRFVVIAYSGTEQGVALIQSHKLRPEVRIVAGCPTIDNTFRGGQLTKVKALCRAFPKRHSEPLGFDETGALIAFAHGCPNNVPPILHSRASGWHPLFYGRSTADISTAFLPKDLELSLDQRTEHLLKIRGARHVLTSIAQNDWILAMMILAAAEAGRRTPEDISSHTRLTLSQVNAICSLAHEALWLDPTGRLTDLGKRELDRLRRRRARAPILSLGPK